MSEKRLPAWKHTTIAELGKSSAGGTPNTQQREFWTNGHIPWMSSGEIHKRRVKDTEKFITKLGYENSSAKFFPPKTILIALAGQGKTRGTVAISEIELTTNQSIAGIVIDERQAYPDFVFYNLSSRYDELRTVSGGSGRAGLNLSIINDQIVSLPPMAEQKKIAAILTSVDEVIEKTEAQIAKLQDLKTAMMQELLTKGIGHTDFKDSPVGRIPTTWIVNTLEAARITVLDGDRGMAYPKEADFTKTGYCLFLSAKNITENGLMLNDRTFISSEKDGQLRKGRVEPGDIVITTRGTVGNVSLFREVSPFKAVRINSGMAILRNKNKGIDTNYLYAVLRSEMISSQIKKQVSGSAQPQLTVRLLKDLLIAIPSQQEQLEIARVIGRMDYRRDIQKQRLSAVKSLKKALMQDLLTGRVRVKV